MRFTVTMMSHCGPTRLVSQKPGLTQKSHQNSLANYKITKSNVKIVITSSLIWYRFSNLRFWNKGAECLLYEEKVIIRKAFFCILQIAFTLVE